MKFQVSWNPTGCSGGDDQSTTTQFPIGPGAICRRHDEASPLIFQADFEIFQADLNALSSPLWFDDVVPHRATRIFRPRYHKLVENPANPSCLQARDDHRLLRVGTLIKCWMHRYHHRTIIRSDGIRMRFCVVCTADLISLHPVDSVCRPSHCWLSPSRSPLEPKFQICLGFRRSAIHTPALLDYFLGFYFFQDLFFLIKINFFQMNMKSWIWKIPIQEWLDD